MYREADATSYFDYIAGIIKFLVNLTRNNRGVMSPDLAADKCNYWIFLSHSCIVITLLM